ncbi:MAG: c-type cytochrome [Burkholderiales bacterium]|nr:c-type cytochrome [Burkholderiales bacterium]
MKALIPLLILLAGTAQAADRIERGHYLVNTSGCMDCHTPLKMGAHGPEPDVARRLSGHPQELVITAPVAVPAGPWMAVTAVTATAFSGPWGVSFTANLTPDMETGLGRWSEEDFVQTIRTGRHLGRGRPVLPPMPIPVYNQMTDDDLKAVFAYLKSLPPIRNKVPEPLLPAQP